MDVLQRLAVKTITPNSKVSDLEANIIVLLQKLSTSPNVKLSGYELRDKLSEKAEILQDEEDAEFYLSNIHSLLENLTP